MSMTTAINPRAGRHRLLLQILYFITIAAIVFYITRWFFSGLHDDGYLHQYWDSLTELSQDLRFILDWPWS